jgi:hypothetical protein
MHFRRAFVFSISAKNWYENANILPKWGDPKIWVITEWDRTVTPTLFPEEY